MGVDPIFLLLGGYTYIMIRNCDNLQWYRGRMVKASALQFKDREFETCNGYTEVYRRIVQVTHGISFFPRTSPRDPLNKIC